MADPVRTDRVPLVDSGDDAGTPLDRVDDALFRPVVVGSSAASDGPQ